MNLSYGWVNQYDMGIRHVTDIYRLRILIRRPYESGGVERSVMFYSNNRVDRDVIRERK